MEKQSLRSFLATLKAEQVRTFSVRRRDYILSALVRELERRDQTPVVRLVDPESGRVTVANIFADRSILGAVIQNVVDVEQVANTYAPVPCAAEAPVQTVVYENDTLDAEALPIFRHFLGDAGRYITSGVVAARDPDTGRVNLSFHRLMLKGKDRFGISLHSMGDLWDYQRRAAEKGKDLDIAVIVGAHPALYFAGATKVPPCFDDYAYAGAYMGEPLEVVQGRTVDVPVPAYAEYILEGCILRDTLEDEGPFAEYTGYSTSRSTRNVFEVRCITSRKEPIWQELVPGFSNEHLMLSQFTREVILLHKLRREIPEVAGLCIPKEGCHFHAYLSFKPCPAGKARQAMLLLFGLDLYLKLIVAVDADVDIYDEKQVLKALANNFQADRDMFLVPNVICNRLDPSSRDGMSAKLGLDATSTGARDEEVCLPAEAEQAALALLGG